MRSPKYILLFFFFAFIISCGKTAVKKNQVKNDADSTTQTQKENTPTIKKNNGGIDPSGEEIVLNGIDTTRYIADTILKLAGFKLVLAKEKYDAEKKHITKEDLWGNPITMFVFDIQKDSLIFKKGFDENQFVTTNSFKDGTKNYITLSMSGGGSGFVSTIYKIETEDGFNLKTIVSYNELCYYTFDKEGNELLLLQGIWAMFAEGSDDMGETHFADHVYDISTVDLSNDKIISHGTTRNKYPSEDSGTNPMELFRLIQKKEPKICKNIDPEKYAVQ